MKSMFSVILAFSLPLAIFANVINEKECDVSKGEIYLSGAPQSRTFESCRQACQDDSACQSITFYDNGSCSLFSTKCENTRPMTDAHSELVKELGGLFGLECDNSQGELWLAKSQEADLAGCKQTCEDEPTCQSVTFYHHGVCSLFSTKCEKTRSSPGAQSALVKELSGKTGQECDTSQGEIYLTGDHEADFAECKKSCEDDAHCHSVTYFHEGYCSLFATACDKMKANPAARSALVKEIKHSQEQCEIDGTCHHGEECDRSKGEEYMADGSGKKSYEECKQACMDRSQCQSITYFVHGVCSLFKTQCQNRKPCKDAVARTLKADFFNKQECDGDKGEIFLSASSGNTADLEACRQSCEDATDCKSTTFFKSGYCSHYSTCCKNRKPSANGNADAVKTATCIDACVIENGGCDSKRACTSTDGVATCGDCPAPFVNDGAKDCKKPAPADPCKKNNGGCHSKRACTSKAGQVTCGHCASGYYNDGAKGCQQDPCKKNNGGCHSKRRCTSKGSQVRCGNCAGGLVNDGAKGCKAKAKPKPTEPGFPYPSNYPAASCAKMKPKCSHITAASCQKPCSLKGGHSCCSYRIGGCHSCCAGGYLNDKCCPPNHGKCQPLPVPKTNPCKTPGCQRAPAFDGKKCPEFKNGKKHPDRCFKETGKTVDECAAICSKDAACNFFSHPKEARGWCIGCKVAPSAKHPGAMSYAQTTTGVKWTIGIGTTSCDDVCAYRGGCSEQNLKDLTNRAAITAAFKAAGVTCVAWNSWDYKQGVSVCNQAECCKGNCVGHCSTPVTKGCGAKSAGGQQRLCPCLSAITTKAATTATPTTTTTAGEG